MNVSPDQVVIGAGSQTLYQLLVQLLGRTRRYAVEDPGYPLLTRMYEQQDAQVAHIGLDDSGINVAALEASDASVAHIMPSHQFPTGIVTTAARRRELLNWAREGDRYLIEDDYDSEFRMAGRPIPSLFGIDAAERVLYLNSFAKSLGAAFRMAYLVLPPQLARRFREQLGFYASTVSPLDQLALARFIEQGHYDRHVNRLRTHARKTQDALVNALHEVFSDRIAFAGLNDGLHFTMQLESEHGERELAAAAEAAGVRIAPLSDFAGTASLSAAPTGTELQASTASETFPARFILRRRQHLDRGSPRRCKRACEGVGISQHRKRFTDPARDSDAASARRRPSVTLAAAKRPQTSRDSPPPQNDSQTPPKHKKARAGCITQLALQRHTRQTLLGVVRLLERLQGRQAVLDGLAGDAVAHAHPARAAEAVGGHDEQLVLLCAVAERLGVGLKRAHPQVERAVRLHVLVTHLVQGFGQDAAVGGVGLHVDGSSTHAAATRWNSTGAQM